MAKRSNKRRRAYRPQQRPKRSKHRKVLVVVEGSRDKSEARYFELLNQELRNSYLIAITVEPGQGEPSRVLQACDARTERERERKNINGEPFDIRILVIDVDNHQRLESTLRECKKKNIHALVTNPKFELWLLWHLEDMNHSVTGNKLDQLVQGKKLVAGPRGKELAHNFPFGNYREAMGVRGKRGAI